jgi:hypothetical protein
LKYKETKRKQSNGFVSKQRRKEYPWMNDLPFGAVNSKPFSGGYLYFLALFYHDRKAGDERA